jgi:hypothetical protein
VLIFVNSCFLNGVYNSGLSGSFGIQNTIMKKLDLFYKIKKQIQCISLNLHEICIKTKKIFKATKKTDCDYYKIPDVPKKHSEILEKFLKYLKIS